MQQKTNKLKPELKIADDFLDLRNTDTHVVIAQMEENMKMRESSAMRKQFDEAVRIAERARQSPIGDIPLEKQLRRLAKRH